ncbi:MAG TPA: twin-arginine translocase TatA/TatE family subunit [Rubrobacter sp.]|nr:twin-arginine translocase TatA/TatE family subunit [Rubrobacter sp.]
MSVALIPLIPSAGAPELIIVLVVILLLFGAKRIPELARGLGSGVREFKAGTKEGQLEDKNDEEKKDGEGATSETKTDDEAKLESDANVESEKAEQKRG